MHTTSCHTAAHMISLSLYLVLCNIVGRFDYHDEFGDRRMDVTSARTYFYDSEGQCDKNMWTFMKCVDVVHQATEGTGLAAIKLTALGRPQFLVSIVNIANVYDGAEIV